MSVNGKTTMAAWILTAAGTPLQAFAAENRAAPNDLGVWIFIGFCALIVTAQIVPLLRRAGRKRETHIADQAAQEKQTH
ncbi:hypothetical protein [Geobacter sp. SVR]|uniref:hypothetical protein n=1 Tax=Geobacter sp. SVR TaxID=2495594 RepID=UPI00143EF4B4|nr:hypothetical protein [Geobacter sp. SVR]BCS54442.1 hypothetical protein GSVR_27500 [Geobacter sp. SVR]GCF87674.1 hypothetical protein GSbR_42740 [Geobacter sp. SVR]